MGDADGVRRPGSNLASGQHNGRPRSGEVPGLEVPTKKEVQEARRKAVALLDGLRKKAKEYEAELLSRGWRV